MSNKVLFGFHAVTVRMKTAPATITEIHVDATRRDARMRQFVERARDSGARVIDSDDERLTRMAGGPRHQGVVARVEPLPQHHSLDDLLDAIDAEGRVSVRVSVERARLAHRIVFRRLESVGSIVDSQRSVRAVDDIQLLVKRAHRSTWINLIDGFL